MAGGLTLVARAAAWPPVCAGVAAAFVGVALAGDSRAEVVPLAGVVVVASLVWLVEDPALTLTACAPRGRRTQLAVRCAAAFALAAVAWAVGAATTGATFWSYDGLSLLAVLAFGLAGGIVAGAAAGSAVAIACAVGARMPPPGVAVTGARWWWVLAAGVAVLGWACRDPAPR